MQGAINQPIKVTGQGGEQMVAGQKCVQVQVRVQAAGQARMAARGKDYELLPEQPLLVESIGQVGVEAGDSQVTGAFFQRFSG